MAKILSQDEIDALLSTVSAGDDLTEQPEEKEEDRLRSVVVYDFKHPNRVSKDQLRTLENMHDNFAGHIGSVLSNIHRAMLDVDLVSVDQITYSEFVMSLVSPSCTFTFTGEPLEGACIVDFNPTLTYAFIERMFGGQGKVVDTGRELTGIERSLMNRIVKVIYKELEDAWAHICPIKIKQASLETNPQFVQIVPPGETVIVISFQLKLLQSTGLITICYPYVALENIIGKLSAQNWIDATKRKTQSADEEINKDNLMRLKVPVQALLAKTSVRIRDFIDMKVGDVITTDNKITREVDIMVKNSIKFTARPGTVGNKKGFIVTNVLEELGKE
ncbi:MAG: flagellar motor switch protein FliM [candidate division Zixibacteria bacterium]|nr:flagellar motor switch protein FliM [candidate division Zixibacteria bacterium]